MLSRLDLRQLWYLSQSGMVRLSFRLPEIKKVKQNNEKRKITKKPEKHQKMREEEKWEAFRKKFGWVATVNELLKEGEDEGGTN